MRVDTNTKGHRQWFYFSIKSKSKKLVKFNIYKFRKPYSLYQRGMRPYVLSLKDVYGKMTKQEKQNIFSDKQNDNIVLDTFNWWKPRGINVRYMNQRQFNQYGVKKDTGYYFLTFQYQFSHQNDEVFFAAGIPYTYTYLEERMNDFNFQFTQLNENVKKNNSRLIEEQPQTQILQSKKNQPIFPQLYRFQTKIIGKSMCGLDIKIIKLQPNNLGNSYYQRKTKKIVILNARTHSGQTSGSWVLDGLIQNLIKKCKQNTNTTFKNNKKRSNIFFQNNIVFYILPMLNVDGVLVGNYRTGIIGQDFNRKFNILKKQIFPQIYYLKRLVYDLRSTMDKQKIKYKFLMFMDLHGHSILKNSFIYGPDQQDFQESQCYLLVRKLPFYLWHKSNLFKMSSCRFKTQKQKIDTARMYFQLKENMLSFTCQNSLGLYQKTLNCQNTSQNQQYTAQDWKKFGASIIEAIKQIYLNQGQQESSQEQLQENLGLNNIKTLQKRNVSRNQQNQYLSKNFTNKTPKIEVFQTKTSVSIGLQSSKSVQINKKIRNSNKDQIRNKIQTAEMERKFSNNSNLLEKRSSLSIKKQKNSIINLKQNTQTNLNQFQTKRKQSSQIKSYSQNQLIYQANYTANQKNYDSSSSNIKANFIKRSSLSIDKHHSKHKNKSISNNKNLFPSLTSKQMRKKSQINQILANKSIQCYEQKTQTLYQKTIEDMPQNKRSKYRSNTMVAPSTTKNSRNKSQVPVSNDQESSQSNNHIKSEQQCMIFNKKQESSYFKTKRQIQDENKSLQNKDKRNNSQFIRIEKINVDNQICQKRNLSKTKKSQIMSLGKNLLPQINDIRNKLNIKSCNNSNKKQSSSENDNKLSKQSESNQNRKICKKQQTKGQSRKCENDKNSISFYMKNKRNSFNKINKRKFAKYSGNLALLKHQNEVQQNDEIEKQRNSQNNPRSQVNSQNVNKNQLKQQVNKQNDTYQFLQRSLTQDQKYLINQIQKLNQTERQYIQSEGQYQNYAIQYNQESFQRNYMEQKGRFQEINKEQKINQFTVQENEQKYSKEQPQQIIHDMYPDKFSQQFNDSINDQDSQDQDLSQNQKKIIFEYIESQRNSRRQKRQQQKRRPTQPIKDSNLLTEQKSKTFSIQEQIAQNNKINGFKQIVFILKKKQQQQRDWHNTKIFGKGIQKPSHSQSYKNSKSMSISQKVEINRNFNKNSNKGNGMNSNMMVVSKKLHRNPHKFKQSIVVNNGVVNSSNSKSQSHKNKYVNNSKIYNQVDMNATLTKRIQSLYNYYYNKSDKNQQDGNRSLQEKPQIQCEKNQSVSNQISISKQKKLNERIFYNPFNKNNTNNNANTITSLNSNLNSTQVKLNNNNMSNLRNDSLQKERPSQISNQNRYKKDSFKAIKIQIKKHK